MSDRLTKRERQQRELTIPAPGRKGNIKVTREGWIACAKVVLIEEGIGAVKVDRLAKRLDVTRGGFYYHFENHHQLLEALLDSWRHGNRFTPRDLDPSTPEKALQCLERICDDIIHEREFDPQFDMAIREWARVSEAVSEVVRKVDAARMNDLKGVFAGMGYGDEEAATRARVFYTHQIGWYTIGVEESLDNRQNKLKLYLDVLAGSAYRQLAHAHA